MAEGVVLKSVEIRKFRADVVLAAGAVAQMREDFARAECDASGEELHELLAMLRELAERVALVTVVVIRAQYAAYNRAILRAGRGESHTTTSTHKPTSEDE